MSPFDTVFEHSGNSSLWSYEETMMLYPHFGCRYSKRAHSRSVATPTDSRLGTNDQVGALVPTFSASKWPQSQSSLRGSVAASSISDAGVDAGRKSRRNVGQQRALIPSVSRSDNPTSVPTFLSVSSVLMTEGKALLDPAIVRSSRVAHSPTFVFRSEGPEDMHVHDPIRVPSPKAMSDASLGNALVASSLHNSFSHQYANSHHHDNINNDHGTMAVDASSAPQFVMMLPLKSVKWGTSWNDDDSLVNPLTQLLKSMQDNSSGTEQDDISSYWIELGCSIVKAQLVKNITLST